MVSAHGRHLVTSVLTEAAKTATEVVAAALYRRPVDLNPSPAVHPNRAVAVAMADGPEAGRALVRDLTADLQGRH